MRVVGITTRCAEPWRCWEAGRPTPRRLERRRASLPSHEGSDGAIRRAARTAQPTGSVRRTRWHRAYDSRGRVIAPDVLRGCGQGHSETVRRGRFFVSVRICHDSLFAANTNINAALENARLRVGGGHFPDWKIPRPDADFAPGVTDNADTRMTSCQPMPTRFLVKRAAIRCDRAVGRVASARDRVTETRPSVLRCPFTPLVLMDYSSGNGARIRPSHRSRGTRVRAARKPAPTTDRPHLLHVVVNRHIVATLGSILETANRVGAHKEHLPRCT